MAGTIVSDLNSLLFDGFGPLMKPKSIKACLEPPQLPLSVDDSNIEAEDNGSLISESSTDDH